MAQTQEISSESSDENVETIAKNPSSENENEYTSYVQEQKKDLDIVWISNLIEKNGENKPEIKNFENVIRRLFYKEYEKLRLVENVLYRMYEDNNGVLINQFVMPKQIEEKIVKHIHESIFNGHLGRNKTMEKVTTRFYRPYIRKTIKRVIKQCEVCQKVKNVNYNKQTEVLRIRTTQPNELITTDFAGPFKCTIRGNKYFQIIMDHG